MENLNTLLEQMDGLKDMEAKLKLELKNVEKEQSKIELALTKVLSETDQDYIESGIYSFGWKTTSRTAFDQKLFSTENPTLFEKYKVTKEAEKFEFKING